MKWYRVSFYKTLLNSDGHSFKCLQRQIDVQSNEHSQAMALAEQQMVDERLNVDCVEVALCGDHNELEHPSDSCKHIFIANKSVPMVE